MRLRSRLGVALSMTLFAVSYIPDAAIAQTSASNQKQAPSKDKPKQNQSANKAPAAKPGSANKQSKTTKPAKAANASTAKKTKDVRVSVTRPANNATTGARPSFATAMGLRGQHDFIFDCLAGDVFSHFDGKDNKIDGESVAPTPSNEGEGE